MYMTMLSTMLHVVILMIAIVGADKTCTKEEDISHLVQSLQNCANAITGLQPSSEIQEKCSPDAGLLQKIENISSTLANITQQIAAIEENIATNKYNITQQIAAIEESIAINEYNITANNKISINEDIITIQKNIADNAVNIATNAASITTNAGNIATNAANITTNADNIATNTASITANTGNIATNAASIATNADNIATNAASITANADNIATNAASITTNADNIATNKEAIANSVVVCHSSGWTRVGYLDMSLTSEECPTGFGLYNESGKRACGKKFLSYGCNSVTFSTYGISYSEVCGRVIGYQYGRPDGLHNGQINGPYIEGISITHGSPRQHVWTLINGNRESGSNYCPCNTDSTKSVPSIIGNDYFCESGTASAPTSPYQLYTDDPLWDGKGCGGKEGPCCNTPDIPWFHKVLNSTTTDYIELRVCRDNSDEDTPVTLYEIYVK